MGTIPCPINYVYMRGAMSQCLRSVVFGQFGYKIAFLTILLNILL